MAYKVFFVEDEDITREGIRDNVDWAAHGFEFCGEATDGEIALPLLHAAQPDVLITDIKMPFMDGLQLCKIVRERLPWIKIIILSGHDEFEYAQKAIELGVKEYLLKPITVKKMHQALQKIASSLDEERKEQENLKKLREQMQENLSVLRERFLLKLVVGAVSSSEAIEKAQQLHLDLIARSYLVVLLKIQVRDRSESFDYVEYQQIQNLLAEKVDPNPDIFLIKKDWEEVILLMKGATPEYLEEECNLLLDQIRPEINKTRYQLMVGFGTPQKRLSDAYQSFLEAMASLQNTITPGEKPLPALGKEDLLAIDKIAVEEYLRRGIKEYFDEFFDDYLNALGERAIESELVKSYILINITVVTARLVKEWGGDIDQVVPELNTIETALNDIKTMENLKARVGKILLNALQFRDAQGRNPHARLVMQAKEFIIRHFSSPELSLNQVAASVNLSPSHFSLVFGQETSQTFKDYLTETRIQKAKELLRTSTLPATEIGYQVGYGAPHYFSHVFKKKTGLSPTEFRAQALTK